MKSVKSILLAAACTAFLGVLLGAWGAHGLRPALEAGGHLAAWETAVLYQLVHGLALLAAGIWLAAAGSAAPRRMVMLAAALWLGGAVLFSGSLYGLSLGGPRWLGPVTPVGGLGFLAGWVAFALAAARARPAA